MANTHIVVKGDTLSEIAEKYLSGSGFSSIYGSNGYLNYLIQLNNIKDPNRIVIGQKIALNAGGESSTSNANTTNTTSRPIISLFGLQSNTDRTLYVTWTWSKPDSETDGYQVNWYYDTGDNIWFVGSSSTVKDKQCTYSAPENALRVKVKVKAVSKTHKVNDKETVYWTSGWSTEPTYSFSDSPPKTPNTPSVEIKKYTLTASLSNLDLNADTIEFQVVKDDISVCNTGRARISTSSVTYSCTISAGSKYKVRCRAVRGNLYSDWSQYSSNGDTIPSVPKEITVCRAASSTSIYLAWTPVSDANTYEIQYTTKLNYFDGSNEVKGQTGIEVTYYTITGLSGGDEYFFRVRAVNNVGASGWSEIRSTVVGKPPSAPTTWSSTTTAVVSEPLTLYWMHNSEDGSKEKYAEIELYFNGLRETQVVRNSYFFDDEIEDTAKSYTVDTTKLNDGYILEWRVRTAGITDEYGDWSIQRTVTVHAPPTLEMTVLDSSGNAFQSLTSLPIQISAKAGPTNQKAVGYHLAINALESYETTDNIGNPKIVNFGDSVYSKYFDNVNELLIALSADTLSLENNIHYDIVCTVSMDSGLTTHVSSDFRVAWTDLEYEPNAEIGIDSNAYTAHIRPFCEDEYGRLIEGVTLSVYRREFDGSFTELATGIANTNNTFITDPHPALDFARYRIVAITDSTSAVSYTDLAGYPVGCTSVLIQWDEDWSGFDVSEETELEQRPWTGSLLKLPYNIDVSDSYKPDMALIEYIGREYPVSYYGTHLGMTSSWSTVIPKDDKETIYALRRLATWMGDVYVREPSGTGYWAHVTVTFPQKHLDVTIPVTLSITRVAGGI